MAFPTVVRRGAAVSAATNATSWTPTVDFTVTNGLNTAISAGEKVLWTLIVAADGIPTLTETGVSATKVGQISESGSQVTGAVFTLETTSAFAAGAHPAFVISSSTSEQFSCLLYADKASSSSMSFGVLSNSGQGTGSNTNPVAITNSSGAARDVHVRCARLGDGSTTVATAAPASYSNLVTQVGSGTAGANSSGAFRAINIASSGTEDPGTFTSPAEQWTTWTVGVYEFSSGYSITADVGSYTLTGTSATPYKASPLVIVNNVGTTVTNLGSNNYEIEKTSGLFDYDADAISTTAVSGDFILRLRGVANASFNFFSAGGMNTDPTSASNIATINFVWAFIPSNSTWGIYEDDVAIVGGFADSTYAWMWRTGTTLGYGRGATLEAAKASPDRTTTSTGPLYFDSSFAEVGQKIEAQLYSVPSAVMYGMSAGKGTYALTGTAAALSSGFTLTADPGSYSLTGTTTGLLRTRVMPADVGGYILTGTAASLLHAWAMPAAVGSYVLTGTPANLLAGRYLAGAVGSYTLTGVDVTLTEGAASITLVADPGSYSLTGTAATLTHGYVLVAAVGSYALSGTATGLIEGHVLAAAPGSYTLSGVSAAMFQGAGGAPPKPRVTAFFYRG